MLWISIIIALLALIIGSITDLKKREVHDYVSYGLIFSGFSIGIIYSIIYWDYSYILQTVMGFILGLGIAYAMFYMGQWGGGDSKLIMGLGAILGFNIFGIFGITNLSFIILLINIIFAGAIYGLIWSIYLAFKHRKQFMKSLKQWSEKKNISLARKVILALTIILAIIILLIIPAELKLLSWALLSIMFVIFYVWIFVKIIEESCMIKSIPLSKLTEGDWIYKDIYVGKKYVAGPKDLGISREQIALLKKYSVKEKIREVQVKEGIPFIPVFLIAYILVLVMHNINIPTFLS
jgi:Flp pilus assembly protein protease CpaA